MAIGSVRILATMEMRPCLGLARLTKRCSPVWLRLSDLRLRAISIPLVRPVQAYAAFVLRSARNFRQMDALLVFPYRSVADIADEKTFACRLPLPCDGQASPWS